MQINIFDSFGVEHITKKKKFIEQLYSYNKYL